MKDEWIDPQHYIELIETRTGSEADPLVLLDTAATASHQLADAGQHVLEHFARHAHQAGCSWTQVGERLGISRQAARQRFTTSRQQPSPDSDLEVLPRLQACLDQALVEGADDGRGEIDSQYLLLGLLRVGVAAAALDRLGVTRDKLRTAMRELFDVPAGGSGNGVPVLSREARQVVDDAHALARSRGHRYVGTEHLLFCLATDSGSQAFRVLTRLGVEIAAVKRELREVIRPRTRLPLRRKTAP